MKKVFAALTSIVGLVALVTSGCASTRSGKRIDLSEQPDLAPANGGESRLVWKEARGIDFTVFYGDLKGSKRSGVGIYWGSYPNVRRSGTPEAGKLGIFDVQWYPAPQPELWEEPKGQSKYYLNRLVILQQIRGTL